MDTTPRSSAAEPPPRLDLFAFPSETRGRFRMLVVAALLMALQLALVIRAASTGMSGEEHFNSLLNEYAGTAAQMAPPVREARFRNLSGEYVELLAPQLTTQLWCLGFLAIAATFLYRTHPLRVRRLQKPRPLNLVEAPSVVSYLRGCAEALGFPHLRIEHRPGMAEGQAYGLKRREALLLHGTPALLEKSWGSEWKAIALHEVGHIVNGDAAEREKAQAVWLSLLLSTELVLTIFLVVVILGLEPVYQALGWPATYRIMGKLGSNALTIFGPFLGMLLVFRLIWAGLIRSREFSADWRVSSWGLGEILDRLLQAQERRCAARRWRIWEAVANWWRLHPSYQARRQALANPNRLFRVTPDVALVTGVLLALMAVYVSHPVGSLGVILSWLVYKWGGYSPEAHILSFIFNATLLACAPFVLSYLLTGALGAQVQREALAGLAHGPAESRGYIRLLMPAFLFSVGMEIGFLAAPLNLLSSVFIRPEIAPPWLVGSTFLTWLWLVYIRAATRLSLGRHVGQEPPRRRRSQILLSAAVLLNVMFWPVALGRIVLAVAVRAERGPLPGLGDGREAVIATVGAVIVLSLFATALYLLWAGAGLGFTSLKLWSARLQCPACGEEVLHGFTLGRACAFCGEELTPWVFAGPPREPGSPEVRRPRDLVYRAVPDARQNRREAWSELFALGLGLAGLGVLFVIGTIGGAIFFL